MAVPEGTPRGRVETDWAARIANELRDIRAAVNKLQRGASLRNSAISGGEGQKVYDSTGALRLSIDTSGSITAYDANELPVARYGQLVDSVPGTFGVEINVDGGWVRLGYQTTGWSQIQKPATYNPTTELWAPAPHTHPGSDVSSPVAEADGSQSGFTRTVGGTEYYALWVDNTSGYKFGRNTSSRKYKINIVAAPTRDPKRILKLQEVVYDRKDFLEPPPPGTEGPSRLIPGVKGEYGLIAEDTALHVPEIITRYNGEIDGIRYDLLPVAMLPLLRQQQATIDQQAIDIEKLKVAVRSLGGEV